MRRRTFLGVAAGTTVATTAGPVLTAPRAFAATVPQTIPALREWTAGAVSFTYRTGSRIVVELAHAGPLTATAAVFADDLRALTGIRPAVVNGARADAQPGDVFLSLDPADVPARPQAYRLEVTDVVAIAATTAAGAFYGTRTVLQLLVQSTTIAGGLAKDWPSYLERGVHIDTGLRKYSMAWWRNLIRDLSFVKLNQVSLMVPGKGLGDAERTELLAFATRHHVEIVPLFPAPNHTGGTINVERPDLALQASEPPATDSMDFTKPGALDVIRQWIERDIDKYPGRYWHGCADEYLNYPDRPMNWGPFPQFAAFARSVTGNPNAQPWDAYTWVLNWINGVVKAHGKVMRIFNDQMQTGGVVPLDNDIVIEHWYQPVSTNAYNPQLFLNRGNPVVNFGYEYLYYDMGRNFPDAGRIYNEFRVTRFHRGEVPYHAGLRGARLATWMFQLDPTTAVEDNLEMYDRIHAPLRSLAQLTWDSPKFTDFAGFQALYQRLGHAPGYLPLTPVVAAPAVVLRDPFGRLSVTARTGDQVRHLVQEVPAGPFSAPLTVGTGIAGSVVATADRDGRAVYFARTAAGTLVTARQADPGSGSWSTTQLAAGVAGDPSVLLDWQGRLTYFVRATSGALLHGWENEPADPSRGWGSAQLTTGIAGDPVGAMDGFGRLMYFVRTTAGELRHGWHTQSGGRTWRDDVLIGGLGGDPAVTVDSVGRFVYFVRTASGELRHGWQVNVATGPWNSAILGTGIAGRPVPWVDRSGRVLYFVRTVDDRLLHGWQSQPSQGPWGSGPLATGIAGDPAVGQLNDGRVLYFARTVGGGLQHGRQSAPMQGPWTSALLTTGAGGDPTTALDRDGRVTYLVHATTGALWHGRQPTPDGAWERITLTT